MPISGIGAFGEGALQGYDKALSNYAQIAELARQREAARRAEQSQQLQALLHGTKLATESPDVAEIAARDPQRYGMSADTLSSGAARARVMQDAQSRLNQALSMGDLEALNDPEVARLIGEKHLPVIKEIQDRKKVDAIMQGPGTPQEKARALVALGAKVDSSMLEKAYPDFQQAGARAQALGTAEGQLPLAESLSRAKAVGQASGELQYAGPLAQAKRGGELGAELSPDVTPSGVPLGGTSAGRLARERETPADRDRKLRRNDASTTEPKDLSVILNRNRTQARQEVEQHIRSSAPVFKTLPPQDQMQILDYYTAVRQNAMLSSDPGWAGQPVPPLPAKPPSVVKFEAEGQDTGGFLSGLKSLLFGAATPTEATPDIKPTPAAPAPPRTLRAPEARPTFTPEQSAQIIRASGAKEGEQVTQKSTGKTFRVRNGQLVPE